MNKPNARYKRNELWIFQSTGKKIKKDSTRWKNLPRLHSKELVKNGYIIKKQLKVSM